MNNERLKQIDIENQIFIIYYIIITLSIISNEYEKKYFMYGDEVDRETYRNLLLIIFWVVFLIYLYYTIIGIEGLGGESNNPEVDKLNKLSVLANVLVLISAIIYLYIIYKDRDINVEVVFS